MEHCLAAILAADVVGYSKLMGEDQSATLDALRQFRSELLAPTTAQHGGDIVKSMGDGWFIAFTSVSSAVQCAIDIQNGVSDIPMLQLRMGVHLGDITQEDEDLFGDGVNIAARLQEAAAPGDILISDTVHQSLDGKLGGAFHKTLPLKLKNIARVLTGFSWSNRPVEARDANPQDEPPSTPQQKIKLGFYDLKLSAGDDEARLLCDGVSEAIRAALAIQGGFTLLTDADKADMVVEGVMHARDTRYRTMIRLVDREKQALIKSERFDGVIADLFEAEDELALRICTSLRFAAFAYEASAVKKSDLPLEDQESGAIRVHVGGLLSDLKYGEWLDARRLMETVLDRDPDDASALAMAGMACTIEPHCGWRNPPREDREQAILYLRKAVRLNLSSDFAHTCLSLALLELAEDHAGALFTAEQLMKIAPHYAQGQIAHSAAMIFSGRLEEGVQLASRAIEPPTNRQLFSYNTIYLMIGLLLARRCDEVLHWGQMVNQRVENVPRNLLLMISAAAHMQDQATARDYSAKLLQHHKDFALSGMRVWPLKRAGDWDHVLEGLLAAELPQ